MNAEHLWRLYSQGKQTTEQLAQRYGRSRKTISRYLQKVQTKSDFVVVQNANILMDTTYFNRQYDVMLLYDSISKQGLLVEEVRYESNALYLEAIRSLQTKGIHIQSITFDGQRDLEKFLLTLSRSYANFTKCRSSNATPRQPKSLAACELKALALTLKNSTQTDFEAALQAWREPV